METCKECEHYEAYDGPKKTMSGDKAIMFCPKQVEMGLHGHYQTHEICQKGFTPKKPVEKSCETCGARRGNNSTGEPCNVFLGVPSGNCKEDSNWQPIKPDKPKTKCEKCVVFSGRWETTERSEHCKQCLKNHYSLFSPIEKPDKPKAEVPEKEIGGFISCYDIKEGRRSDVEEERRIDKIIIDAINPPNSKEKTMSRMKKLIRKYVMGCTLYCTAVICIALNPWVCKFWIGIQPKVMREDCSNPGDCVVCDIIGPWLYTLISIATIVAAIYAFNKATDFIFGKLEK